MSWGYRGRGNWPGAGPYSDLPPWQRPGWRYGRGACWLLYPPYAAATIPAIKPEDESALLSEQKTLIEEQLKTMQQTLNKIQERLNELNK